jgi:geranylgeranyl pyrophosphate synthase
LISIKGEWNLSDPHFPDENHQIKSDKTSQYKSAEDSPTAQYQTRKKTSDMADYFLENEKLKQRMGLINQEIERYLDKEQIEPITLRDAAYHLILAGGKRLRSLILLLSCEAVGGDIKKVLPITVAVELLQTASLIHDDIIDDGLMRRGVQTVHRLYGDKIAILAGDLLIAWAIRLIGEFGTPELLRHIGSGGMQLCEGEAEDLLMSIEEQENLGETQYFHMVERKTAVFLKNAAFIGAMIGDATPTQREVLVHYAELLGYAFQLRDDILDLQSSQDVSGKTVRSDLRWKRNNYPLIYALESSSKTERKHSLETLDSGNLDYVLKLIEKTNAIYHTNELAKSFVSRAKQALDDCEFPVKELLNQVADFVLIRQY